MEKQANYALVGAATMLLFIGLVLFVIWLARLQFHRDFDQYDIVFDGPVRGLSQGGEVHFNGIKVGEVTRIALDRANPSRVIARARVTSDVPIRVDSYATLEPQGITGVNYVQISAGTPARPLLKEVTPDGRVPVLRSQRSAISDLLEGGGTVLTRTIEALDRMNRVLSDQNIQKITTIIGDAQEITDEAAKRKQIIADLQKTVQDVDAATQEIGKLAASSRQMVDTDGRATMQSLSKAADEAQLAARDLRAMLGKLEGPTSEFATTGLPQLTNSMIQLQQTAASIERLVGELNANPRGALGKGAAKEREVAQ